jgi:hypothetical protein
VGERHQLKPRRAIAPSLALFALSLAACHRAADQGSGAEETADAGTAAVVVPRDHLAPDELVEGTDKAFALPLPRGLTVFLRVEKTVDARGVAQQPAVTSFIQARVTGGKLLRGAHASDFKGVTVAAEPKRLLDIHVEQDVSQTYTKVEVVDATPVPPVIIPAAEAYKVNGMTPDGKLADPQHML